MKIKHFKVRVTTKDKVLILKYNTDNKPEVDEELLFFYDGKNRFVKVIKVTSSEIDAVEIESN